MTYRSSTILYYWVIGFSLLMMACSSAPRIPESHFSKQLYTSRNGQLRYRIPDGWLNTTNDSIGSPNIVWLVRGDFAASITVKEVVVDTETRREVDRSGLSRIADLTLALGSSEGVVSVIHSPEPATFDGLKVFRYSFNANKGDRVYVTLMDVGGKVYEVKALATGNASRTTVENTATVQEMFIRNLVW